MYYFITTGFAWLWHFIDVQFIDSRPDSVRSENKKTFLVFLWYAVNVSLIYFLYAYK